MNIKKSEQVNLNYEDCKLSNPKVLNTFISCLKSLHKQQENKKKNYKKLMNLFSVRVQKYDDSSSHNKTDDKFKTRKGELGSKMPKKKKNINGPRLPSNNNNIKVYSHKKGYDSSKKEFEDNTYENLNAIQINDEESVNERDYEIECNSDSSIYTLNKDNIIYTEDEEMNRNQSKKRKTFSMNKIIMNERAKIFKHKFNKQMDFAKSKKFSREDNLNFCTNEIQNSGSKSNNVNFIRVPNNFIDNSVYNSVNSSDKKIHEDFVNYYLINSLEDDKDLIFYNGEEPNKIKFDENYKCYYSLDQKSRIIYIKPSPTLLSSILTSKIISRKTTQNISNEESVKSSLTPKAKDLENVNVNILNFDHNMIIEKLKNLELDRNDKERDPIVGTVVSSPENEDENDSENFN